jgi:hypothetical protein
MDYAHYMHKTPNELHNILAKRRIPDEEKERIKMIVATQKAERRSNQQRQTQLKLQWERLTVPLAHELHIIKTNLNYKSEDPDNPRILAWRAYEMVLTKLRKDYARYKDIDKVLPSKLAKEKNLENDGLHWVDWVPQKIKERVYAYFADIPHIKHAKKKHPFVRSVPQNIHDKLQKRLIKSADTELTRLERLQVVEPTPERQDRIDILKKAIKELSQTTRHEPLPNTWHGIQDNWGST